MKLAGALAVGVALLLGVPLGGGAVTPYDVEVLLPLSGSGASDAVARQQAMRAIENAVNRSGGIGGRPLHFVIRDDRSKPRVDVELAKAIVARNLPVVLGPASTPQCRAVMPLATSGPVVACFHADVRPRPGSYVFALGTSPADALAASFRYLSGRRLNRVATVDLAAGTTAGITVVDRERVGASGRLRAAQLARIKASKAQAVVVGTAEPRLPSVLRTLHGARFGVPVLAAAGALRPDELRRDAAFFPAQLVVPGAPFQVPELVDDRMQKTALAMFSGELRRIGAQPERGHGDAWDPAMIVVSALRRLGPRATALQIRDYIANLKGFVGINGPYDFAAAPQRGLDRDAVVMMRWDIAKGAWVGLSRPGGIPLGT